MIDNPLDSLRDKIELLQKRDEFQRLIRKFFHERDFLEADVPLFVPAAGMEPHLDPFIAYGMETGQRYFLPTSPEFYLKKLLAAGVEKVFSLAPSFRDEPASKSHSPQFLMLEWYRAEREPKDIVEDCEKLFVALAGSFDLSRLRTTDGKPLVLDGGIEKTELTDLMKISTGISLNELDSSEKWRELAKKHGADADENWSENDCFSFLLIAKVEKELGRSGRPVAVFGYPPFQSALAEVREDGLIDRFEIFIGGVEIANGYNELTGKQKNIGRYIHFQGERMRLDKEPHPADEVFFDAAELMPKAAGIALGADRLLSVLLGREIKDCQHG